MIEVTLVTGDTIFLTNTPEARSILHRAGRRGSVLAVEKGTNKRISVGLASVAFAREVDTTRR